MDKKSRKKETGFCSPSTHEMGKRMNLSKVKVCILDVNGVLIDSNLANARAMGQAFTDDPILQERIATFYLTLTGIDRGEKIRQVQEQVIQKPFEEQEFDQRWENLKTLARRSMGTAPLMPRCRDILGALGRRNITRIALSNTPHSELVNILAEQKLDCSLDIIRGGGNWPKSESLKRLLDEFKFSPECIFIGDGKGDLWAARAADVPFIAIDPDTGEFDGEVGFAGPFQNLADWGLLVGLID
jgi:phosphoglycolate phosphatase-like HAD superfamily hydrolase